MTNPPDECRAAFEAWMCKKHRWIPMWLERDGTYSNPATRGRWDAWREAWNRRPEPEPAEDAVRALGLECLKSGWLPRGHCNELRCAVVFPKVPVGVYDAAERAAQRERERGEGSDGRS